MHGKAASETKIDDPSSPTSLIHNAQSGVTQRHNSIDVNPSPDDSDGKPSASVCMCVCVPLQKSAS